MDIGCSIFLIYAGLFSLSSVLMFIVIHKFILSHRHSHDLDRQLHQQHQKDMKLMEEIDEIDENGEPW